MTILRASKRRRACLDLAIGSDPSPELSSFDLAKHRLHDGFAQDVDRMAGLGR
jgi:hypothetical protein